MEIDFPYDENGNETKKTITVYTTRVDTLFWGKLYLSYTPEHPLVKKIISGGAKRFD